MTQKFFDRLLLFLSLVSLLIILQIKFWQIPFNPFELSEKSIEKSNDIIFNLAISFIAGWMFYVINIQIVASVREKKTRKLIDAYLIDIATQMKVGQLYLERTYFGNRDFNDLTEADFAPINTLHNQRINFSYRQMNTVGDLAYCSTGSCTEIDLFYEERDLVKNNIQIIFSFPNISSLDYEFINLLHKIQTSFFYIGVGHIKCGITYRNFEKHLFEHYENFKALTREVTPRETR